jgi:hypothetical protein
MHQSNPATPRDHQENKARNLQPQLMQHPSQGAARRGDGAGRRSHRPAALGLLPRYPRHRPELSCRRNLAHALDFNSLRRYNGASVRLQPKPFKGGRHLSVRIVFQAERTAIGGNHVDQQLKQLMKELGEAINESLSDSEQIAEVVSRIKEGGYDIFLVLEATIGVSKQGEKSSDKTSLVTTLSTNPEFKINDQDLKFLKSLRIKIEEEKEK